MKMEYKKIINLLDNTPNQPSKFRTKNWVKINDDPHGTYNTNSEIKFKTMMLKSRSCCYSDAYILVNRTMTIAKRGTHEGARQTIERNKGVIFKNWAPFIDCISEINNTTKIDNTKDIEVVMLVYILI